MKRYLAAVAIGACTAVAMLQVAAAPAKPTGKATIKKLERRIEKLEAGPAISYAPFGGEVPAGDRRGFAPLCPEDTIAVSVGIDTQSDGIRVLQQGVAPDQLGVRGATIAVANSAGGAGFVSGYAVCVRGRAG